MGSTSNTHAAKRSRRGIGGRHSYEPTQRERDNVVLLASEGNSARVIATVIGITEPTLRKHFWLDLQRGRDLGIAANSRRLVALAKGDPENGIAPNLGAIIWLDKSRFGINEAPRLVPPTIADEMAREAEASEKKWAHLLPS